MYLTQAELQEVERRFGRPQVADWQAEFAPREFALLEYCARKNRAHDVTLMIRNPVGQFALIRKPSYPEGLFRPPSGGVEPGEPFAAGAEREALEETGLSIRLERYLLRVQAHFTCEGRTAPWTTHILSAATGQEHLEPRDRKEIAEACWGTVEEIRGIYRERMLAVGSAGMRYRVFLQDAALQICADLTNTDLGNSKLAITNF